MKRINIYITEDTDKNIDSLSEIFSESRSEVIRKAIAEYSDKHQHALDNFITDIDDLSDKSSKNNDEWEIEELSKCQNIEYFLTNYVKINTPDEGVVKFNPYKYQISLSEIYSMYRRVIVNKCRNSGVTTLSIAYMVHYTLTNPDKVIAIVSNTHSNATEILSKIKEMVLNLPDFIKTHLGVDNLQKIKWNKSSVRFANGSSIITSGATVDAMRGRAISFLYLDNFAFVPKNIADEFIKAVFPTVLSSKHSRLVIASTPNGPNHFYKIWTDSISDYLDFHPIAINYRMLNSDLQKRVLEQKKIIGVEAFYQEYECGFNTNHRGVLDVV